MRTYAVLRPEGVQIVINGRAYVLAQALTLRDVSERRQRDASYLLAKPFQPHP